MDQGPPLLQPFEDNDLLSEKIKINGLSNGDQSPQMPTLFQADRDTNNLMNIQDMFSALTEDDHNTKSNDNNKSDSRSQPDSFFEKMYKDYGSLNNIEQEPNDTSNTPENIHNHINTASSDTISPTKTVNHDDTQKNTSTDKEKSQKSETFRKPRENVKKNRKRKANNYFEDSSVDDVDLKKLGIKNTKIQRRVSKTNQKKSNIQSIPTKEKSESKHLKSPYILPRSQSSPKKASKSVNFISCDYELINPSLKSTNDYNSSSVYRPNIKSIYNSNASLSQHYPAVCVYCGQKPDFLELGFMYGPYFVDSNYIQSLPLTSIFPSKSCEQESSIGISGKSAIKPDSNGGLKMVIQSSRATQKSNKKNSPNSVDYRLTWEGEVWFHRECVLWAPGTYMRGDGKIGGLEDSLKLALNAECFICNKIGAILNCTTKNCDKNFHYYCAHINESKMNEDQLTMLCKKHKDR